MGLAALPSRAQRPGGITAPGFPSCWETRRERRSIAGRCRRAAIPDASRSRRSKGERRRGCRQQGELPGYRLRHRKFGGMKGKSCEEAAGPHRNRFATEGWSHTGSIPARGEPWIGCGPALSRTDKACVRSSISAIHQDKRACGHGRLWSSGLVRPCEPEPLAAAPPPIALAGSFRTLPYQDDRQAVRAHRRPGQPARRRAYDAAYRRAMWHRAGSPIARPRLEPARASQAEMANGTTAERS